MLESHVVRGAVQCQAGTRLSRAGLERLHLDFLSSNLRSFLWIAMCISNRRLTNIWARISSLRRFIQLRDPLKPVGDDLLPPLRA
jgi:hypothetical protein